MSTSVGNTSDGVRAIHLEGSGSTDTTDTVESLLQQATTFLKVHRAVPNLAPGALDGAVQYAGDALKATNPDHPQRFKALQLLGLLHFYRYKERSIHEDLELSIEFGFRGLEVTSPGHQIDPTHRLILKASLTQRILRRFLDNNSILVDQDLKYDIGSPRDFERAISGSNCNVPDMLSTLALYEAKRFEKNGNMQDLNKSVEAFELSVNQSPSAVEILQLPRGVRYSGQDKWGPARLGDWARQLFTRYGETLSRDDLDKSIEVLEDLSDAVTEHQDRSSWLIFLANGLWTRTWIKNSPGDDAWRLKNVLEEAMRASPPGSVSRGFIYFILGEMITTAMGLKSTADVASTHRLVVSINDKTMEIASDDDNTVAYLSQYALELFKSGLDLLTLDRSLRQTHLPVCSFRYARNFARIKSFMERNRGDLRLLDRYMQPDQLLKEATALADLPLIVGPKISASLGYLLNWTVNVRSDKQEAISLFQAILDREENVFPDRVGAARILFKLHVENLDWREAYRTARGALRLISRPSLRGLKNRERVQMLGSNWGSIGFASDAAAVALIAGEDPQAALVLLETGRGVLSASIEETRAEVLDLEAQYPDTAKEFGRLQSVADASDTDNALRKAACLEIDQLLVEIRKRPGFEDFLAAPTKKDMEDAARHGPLIVLNVTKYRCDALIVEPCGTRNVRLPNLGLTINKYQKQLGKLDSDQIQDLLEWLWDSIAGPILDSLGIKETPEDNNWPRIWWIPAGALSRFPIHAAGYHGGPSGKAVLDRAISSYSPSIKALIRSRRTGSWPRESAPPSTQDRAVLVAVKDAPGQRELQFAQDEVDALRSLCESMRLEVVEPDQNKQEVLSGLQRCRVFHFAGHGDSNSLDPLKSRLILRDWRENSLDITALLDIDLRQQSPFLAYLSACSTGYIENPRFLDESIHLIGACQIAGFRHVVGTLWEVNDESCVEVARATYQTIKDEHMADRSVCLGLHHAIRNLRGQWQQGSARRRRSRKRVFGNARSRPMAANGPVNGVPSAQRAELQADDEAMVWVPYVHFGP